MVPNLFHVVQAAAHAAQQGVRQCDCCHGFYDYDGAWDDDGIMTSVDYNLCGVSGTGHGFLRGSDGKKTGKVDASTVTVEDGV